MKWSNTITALMKDVTGALAWVGRGFETVIPAAFIATAAVIVAVAWILLSRRYQRCPHCRRLVRRVRAGSLRCPRCGRQYYYGLRYLR
jgi:uncharacterized protein with PIN domain